MGQTLRRFREPSQSIFARLYHTPLVDLLRGRITAGLDPRRAIAAGHLPTPAADVVWSVARRLWLPRRARADVAAELTSHFAEGIAAGQSVEDLVGWFGPVRPAARLIGRAKFRQMSLARRMLWRAPFIVLALAIGFWLMVGGLLVRFWFARPTISRDYWAELNAVRAAPLGAETAWPLYQEAERLLEPSGFKKWSAWAADSERWLGAAVAASIVRRQGEALELVRRAARREYLGFEVRPWHDPEGEADSDPVLCSADLRYVESIIKFSRLLIADLRLAFFDGDQQRVLDDFTSAQRISAQCWQRGACATEQIVAVALDAVCWDVTGRLLAECPSFFDDGELARLSAIVAAQRGGGRFTQDLYAEELFVDDFFQHVFTDDGRGDGHVTSDFYRWCQENMGGTYNARVGLPREPTKAELFVRGAMDSGVWHGRREQRRFVTEYFQLMQRDVAPPPWLWRKFRSIELRDIGPLARRRYAPALLWSNFNIQGSLEWSTQRRDAMLVTLALLRFHLRYGGWPNELAELVPDWMAAIPPDRCDGRPLRYVLRDGQPVLYSLGADFRDDGGRPGERFSGANVPEYQDREAILAGAKVVQESRRGDWILWPLPEE